MADDHAVLTLDLPDREQAPAAARKALTALNGSLRLVSEERLRDAQLLVSELVANAVRHASDRDGRVTLRVHAASETMRVEVSDEGDGFDPAALSRPSPERPGGWGLAIVAALAHRWGVQRGPTTVWFEIDRPRRDTALAPGPSAPA